MKTCICLGFILLLTTPLHAETYSWVDDSGTYNYTENYSSVPMKYRKNVNRRDDPQQEVKQEAPALPGSLPVKTEKTAAESATVPGDEKELYGGKSRAVWRKEMEILEAELSGIEQHIEKVKRQITDTKGVSKAKLGELKSNYDDSRAAYDRKYKSYTELIETMRKAGIAVDIKK